MTGESYKYTLEMKKIIILALSSMMLMISVKSQNIDDALRYSRTFYQGTARFNAMGGAFTGGRSFGYFAESGRCRYVQVIRDELYTSVAV